MAQRCCRCHCRCRCYQSGFPAVPKFLTICFIRDPMVQNQLQSCRSLEDFSSDGIEGHDIWKAQSDNHQQQQRQQGEPAQLWACKTIEDLETIFRVLPPTSLPDFLQGLLSGDNQSLLSTSLTPSPSSEETQTAIFRDLGQLTKSEGLCVGLHGYEFQCLCSRCHDRRLLSSVLETREELEVFQGIAFRVEVRMHRLAG